MIANHRLLLIVRPIGQRSIWHIAGLPKWTKRHRITIEGRKSNAWNCSTVYEICAIRCLQSREYQFAFLDLVEIGHLGTGPIVIERLVYLQILNEEEQRNSLEYLQRVICEKLGQIYCENAMPSICLKPSSQSSENVVWKFENKFWLSFNFVLRIMINIRAISVRNRWRGEQMETDRTLCFDLSSATD